jgi:glutamine synthetase
MLNKFISEIETLQKVLNADSSPVVRFLFSEPSGKLNCITVTSCKIKALDLKIQKILKILTLEKKLILLPDHTTAFSDPCSVQQNYCVMCSIVNSEDFTPYDDRSYLTRNDKEFDAVFSFSLYDEGNKGDIDETCDFRTEILIEGQKSGVDVNSHYITEKKLCHISFSATNPLDLADNIQKMKMITDGISASYGKEIEFFEVTFLTKFDNKIKLENQKHKIEEDLIRFNFRINEMNPYSLIKNLFL